MTNPENSAHIPEHNAYDAETGLFDYHKPFTDDDRTLFMQIMEKMADEDAEMNSPAARPPLPFSVTGFRRTRYRNRYRRTHSHDVPDYIDNESYPSDNSDSLLPDGPVLGRLNYLSEDSKTE